MKATGALLVLGVLSSCAGEGTEALPDADVVVETMMEEASLPSFVTHRQLRSVLRNACEQRDPRLVYGPVSYRLFDGFAASDFVRAVEFGMQAYCPEVLDSSEGAAYVEEVRLALRSEVESLQEERAQARVRTATTTTTAAPTTTTAPPPPPPPTTADPFAGETVSQRNARQKAGEYLQIMAFSRSGLIEQLVYEGFSESDATYGVDSRNVDWFDQAAKKAEEYLRIMSFSRQGLIEQLMFDGFTRPQAEHGADSTGL
jgi:hypothetical protein